MKKILSAALLSLCFCSATHASSSSVCIEGKYYVSGYDPYLEREYEGEASIIQNGDAYVITWHFPTDTGFYTSVGTGILSDKHISFTFEDSRAPYLATHGLQIYKIRHDGDTLSGAWVLYGENLIGHEVLERCSH